MGNSASLPEDQNRGARPAGSEPPAKMARTERPDDDGSCSSKVLVDVTVTVGTASNGDAAGASCGGGRDESIVPLAPFSSVDGGVEDDVEHTASYICLVADGSVPPLGCGCRGSASGAHLVCMVKGAVHAQKQTGWLSWDSGASVRCAAKVTPDR